MRPRVGVRRKGTRTKTKQKHYYSGKKKRHTLKSQIVIEAHNLQIICTAHGTGKEHDFQRLFVKRK